MPMYLITSVYDKYNRLLPAQVHSLFQANTSTTNFIVLSTDT